MRQLPLKSRLKAGFTLIELLIVVAIIAILAVAVLAAINPIEQLNRSRDTGNRSDGGQLISALDRYFAGQEIFPWNDADYTGAGADTEWEVEFPGSLNECATTETVGTTTFCDMSGETATGGWVMGLEDRGEVKQAFLDRVTNDNNPNPLLVWKEQNEDVVYICYEPQSDQFKADAYDRCQTFAATLPAGACPTNNSGEWNGELICLP